MLDDEAALVICDFTKGNRPDVPMSYYSATMVKSPILMTRRSMAAIMPAQWQAGPLRSSGGKLKVISGDKEIAHPASSLDNGTLQFSSAVAVNSARPLQVQA